MKQQVISIGYGRNLFSPENDERARQAACAAAVGRLDLIIFTHARDGFTPQDTDAALRLHPTNSRTRWLMPWDAFWLGVRLVRRSVFEKPHLTSQDPFEAGLVAYLLALVFWLPVTVQDHSYFFGTPYWRKESIGNRLRYWLGRCILQWARRVRVVSSRNEVVIKQLAPAAAVSKLPIAIDVTQFTQEGPRATLPFPPDSFVFLTVARLVRVKNLPLLLEAFAAVHAAHPQTRLLIVGDGPLRSEVERLIEQKFSADTDPPVKLIPWSNEVPALMRAADAYVLTSDYEGWARVLIEAICCGLPVVTTDVGCAGEVIQDGVHGRVVPVRDTTALTEALSSLVADTAFRERVQSTLQTLDRHALPGTDLAQYPEAWRRAILGV